MDPVIGEAKLKNVLKFLIRYVGILLNMYKIIV